MATERLICELSNLQKSADNDWLWPPIADALDTFLRRREAKASGYERIWRLIHLWESIAITLSAVFVTRLRAIELDAQYLKARGLLYGRRWVESDRELAISTGALSGSIDSWIRVLWLSREIETDDVFVGSLKRFLDRDEVISLRSFVEQWERACDVPLDRERRDAPTSPKEAMGHVNTFRNRFAHVPFPNDPMDDLVVAMEDITEQLFSVDPLPWKANEGSPLTGGIMWGSKIFRGMKRASHGLAPADYVRFSFPPANKGEPVVRWDARPFILVNQMQRHHTLTRLKDESGLWEYTRYLAEANAVITELEEAALEWLPIPCEDDYLRGDHEAGEPEADNVPDARQVVREAIAAARRGQFPTAIEQFERIVKDRPDYHIGWLRLGITRREYAARMTEEDAAKKELFQAVEDLKQATQHRYSDQQAQAHYELSKVFYRLYRVTNEPGYLDKASSAVTDALMRTPEAAYLSWHSVIERAQANARVVEQVPSMT